MEKYTNYSQSSNAKVIASKVCLHNMSVCIVYIYYVYRNTHTYSIYFENIYMYLHV